MMWGGLEPAMAVYEFTGNRTHEVGAASTAFTESDFEPEGE